MAELRRFAREADFGEMLAAFGEDGAVILESMVQGDTIAAMRDAVVAHADAVEPGSRVVGETGSGQPSMVRPQSGSRIWAGSVPRSSTFLQTP